MTEYFYYGYYYGNFAVAFGVGPAADVLRLWAGEMLIFDRRDPVAVTPEGWSGNAATCSPASPTRVQDPPRPGPASTPDAVLGGLGYFAERIATRRRAGVV